MTEQRIIRTMTHAIMMEDKNKDMIGWSREVPRYEARWIGDLAPISRDIHDNASSNNFD